MRSFSVVAALLACLLSPPALAKNLPPPKVVVKNIDLKFGFIVINLGEKDTKKGDVYRVTRGGKFVGTINHVNMNSTMSTILIYNTCETVHLKYAENSIIFYKGNASLK